MGRRTLAIAALLCLTDAAAYAFDKKEVKALGSVTLDAAQGERMPVTGGSSDDKVSGGQGLGIRAGLEIPNDEAKTFATQVFAGYKSSHGPIAAITEGLFYHHYIELSRWTVDLLEQYRFAEKFRFGAGATYHFGMKLRCVTTDNQTSAPCGASSPSRPDNALGALAQISSIPSDTFEMGVRYTHIDYKMGGQPFRENAWGLFMVLGFHPWH